MSRYQVEFSHSARREYERLPDAIQDRIQTALDALAEEPRPHGVLKLHGEVAAYRIRVGDYRVVYEILDERLVVYVIRLRHRRDVYG